MKKSYRYTVMSKVTASFRRKVLHVVFIVYSRIEDVLVPVII